MKVVFEHIRHAYRDPELAGRSARFPLKGLRPRGARSPGSEARADAASFASVVRHHKEAVRAVWGWALRMCLVLAVATSATGCAQIVADALYQDQYVKPATVNRAIAASSTQAAVNAAVVSRARARSEALPPASGLPPEARTSVGSPPPTR